MTIRVAIADDHPTLLAGLEYLLAGMPGITMTGMATDSTELVKLLERQPCDVVVTDFSMPGGTHGDGTGLLGFLQRRFPATRLVVLTGLESRAVLRSIQQAGVDAIVGKLDDLEHIHQAIQAAHAHLPYLSPAIETILDDATVAHADNALSMREIEVVRLLAEGLSIADIGDRVGRSRKTISAQKAAAMKKLGLRSDGELIRYAMATGLVHASQGPRGTN